MFKRDLRLFLRCLIPAAVLAAVLAAVCATAVFAVAQGAEKVYTPIKAAVVDGENSVLSRMLISAVAEADHIKSLLKVEHCSGGKAYEGLMDGTYAAVIELPEDFLNDILSGRENRGRITLSSAAAANSEIVASVAAFGELLLASGQYAAFSGYTVIDRYVSNDDAAEKMLAAVNRALLAEAMLAQSRYFTVEVAGYADTGVSLHAHYLMSWLTALTMLCAVMFEHLFTADRTHAMLLRLHVSGIGGGRFLLWKLLLVFGFLLAVLLLGGVAAQGLVQLQWSVVSVLCMTAAAAVIAVTAAACLMVADKGISIWLVGTAVQLFLCGGLVPREMLPGIALRIGDFLPLGAARLLIAPLFGGSESGAPVWIGAVWIAASIGAMLLRIKDLRRKGGGE